MRKAGKPGVADRLQIGRPFPIGCATGFSGWDETQLMFGGREGGGAQRLPEGLTGQSKTR